MKKIKILNKKNLIFIALLLNGCNQSKINNKIDKSSLEQFFEENYFVNYDFKKIISDRIGRKFIFPDSIHIISNNLIIKVNSSSIIKKANVTIIGFIWGDCHICINKLNKWKVLIEDGQFNKTQFIFIVSTTDMQYFLKVLYPLVKYEGLIIVDDKEQINSLNRISSEHIEFNFFLIDKLFNIKLVGDPMIFEKLMDLYANEYLILINKN